MVIITINDVSQNYEVQSPEEMNNHWINLTKDIMSEGRLIYFVEIDGAVYYDNYAHELLTRYSEIKSVKINTITEEQSFFITQQDFQQYAATIIADMGDYIKPLYSGTEKSSNDVLPTVLEAVHWVGNALTFLQHLSQKIDSNPLMNEINQSIDQLNPILILLTEELESGNLIGFADVIQYEFIPLIDEFYSKSKEVEVPFEANRYQQ